MNLSKPQMGIDPFADPLDHLLAELAFSIQLPPSYHEKAEKRYKSVQTYLENKNDLFKNHIESFYPQGSMAIDSTISTKGTDDEYDLDIIAQVDGRFRYMLPLEILKEFEYALKDYQGLNVIRQSRCITINYSDGMHLDISPSIRQLETPERQSHICHAKGPANSSLDKMVPMNAKGFELWYRDRTPMEELVVNRFSKLWDDRDMLTLRSEAEVEDVPEQVPFVVKNIATLALQLHKRFRNILYSNIPGRMPPSILLSFFAGKLARPNTTLTKMVILIANDLIAEIQNATLYRHTISISNPCYNEDILTDRWPESIEQQEFYAMQLKELVNVLEKIKTGQLETTEMMRLLRKYFGDQVVTRASERIASQIGTAVKENNQQYKRNGKLLLPSITIAGTSGNTVTSGKSHTFYGEKI